MRERLLFGYGFKDTEPWPVFAQQLGIPASAKGAFWMIVGNGMDATGRDWSTAWLAPPSLGFQIYAMEARGDETAEDVTQAKVQAFVDRFLKQVGGGGRESSPAWPLREPPWATGGGAPAPQPATAGGASHQAYEYAHAHPTHTHIPGTCT